MDLSLSASQSQLLRHLVLADMSYANQDAAAVAARGLDEETVQDDVQSLTWRGMVAADGGRLSITPLGAAAHYASEVEYLSARLVDVVTLADELEHLTPASAREMHTVRQVAQGAWSLEQATAYASDGPPGRSR
ncbi:hypothetical protein [Streptomyces sp. NBC_01373]|uniref:hypothetical protein n=1 Tax=Streptomyces sp. NBC_01373 TaxID=2903843 RepID=UPI00225B2B9D|nr:hypothetical protein [Streptomyces sp. NBC_01373]MCX4701236.1 hypothetical protein [Streptomyces sp. NBC_01373]